MSSSTPKGVSDAAAQLGVTRRAVLYAIKRGALKAQKLSGPLGPYVLDQQDIDDFKARRAQRVTA